MEDKNFIERRHTPIPESLIEEIAERAADKAVEKMENKLYVQVGKSFLDKLFKLIGLIVLGTALLLESKGYLKIPFGD